MWMKYFWTLGVVCTLLFTSCVSDEKRRLQTDQNFEGEEIYDLSFSLDEHLLFAFPAFEFYQDTLNHAGLPGCPEVEISLPDSAIILTFGGSACEVETPVRSGKLVLVFQDSLRIQDSLIVKKGMVRMEYNNYSVNENSVEGMRILYPEDSTSSGITFRDHSREFVIKKANGSSSKISGDYSHVVRFALDTIVQVSSSGTGSGRNMAGRHFDMEISQVKQFDGACFRSGFVLPASGRESWTIERTVEPDVQHELTYQAGEGCAHGAVIHLADGRELTESQ